MTRSTQLAAALAMAILAGCGVNHSEGPPPPPPPPTPLDSGVAPPFLDTVEARTLHYFWDLTNASNGLTPDRSPTPSFSSLAAVWLARTASPTAVHGA